MTMSRASSKQPLLPREAWKYQWDAYQSFEKQIALCFYIAPKIKEDFKNFGQDLLDVNKQIGLSATPNDSTQGKERHSRVISRLRDRLSRRPSSSPDQETNVNSTEATTNKVLESHFNLLFLVRRCIRYFKDVSQKQRLLGGIRWSAIHLLGLDEGLEIVNKYDKVNRGLLAELLLLVRRLLATSDDRKRKNFRFQIHVMQKEVISPHFTLNSIEELLSPNTASIPCYKNNQVLKLLLVATLINPPPPTIDGPGPGVTDRLIDFWDVILTNDSFSPNLCQFAVALECATLEILRFDIRNEADVAVRDQIAGIHEKLALSELDLEWIQGSTPRQEQKEQAEHRDEKLLERWKWFKEKLSAKSNLEDVARIAMPIAAERADSGSGDTDELRTLRDILRPVHSASYDKDHGCKHQTRRLILDDIKKWAFTQGSQDGSMAWISGMPGTGKSTIMNSVCAGLAEAGCFVADFFCRRDDPDRHQAARIVPALAFQLSKGWFKYRLGLRETLESVSALHSYPLRKQFLTLLHYPLENIRPDPEIQIVFSVDGFDEFDTPYSRASLLKSFSGLVKNRPWLKVIIASRPEPDIQTSFGRLNPGLIKEYILTPDKSAEDIQRLAKHRLAEIAEQKFLNSDWPGDRRRRDFVTSSHGLFIWMQTALLLLEDSLDPDDLINAMIEKEGSSTVSYLGLNPLYMTILNEKIGLDPANVALFQHVVGSIMAVSLIQPLRSDILSQVVTDLSVVHTAISITAGEWQVVVNNILSVLASVLQHSDQQPIRVRHLSFFEFLTGDLCTEQFRLDLNLINTNLTTSCLEVINSRARFNICNLETSFLPNAEVYNLTNRIDWYIDKSLQYSSVNWAYHLANVSETQFNPQSFDAMARLVSTPSFLFWLEVLSLLTRVDIASGALLAAREWLMNVAKTSKLFRKFRIMMSGQSRQLQDAAEDRKLGHVAAQFYEAYRFVRLFRDPISTAVPHIYISATPFTPQNSSLIIAWTELSLRSVTIQKHNFLSWPPCIQAFLGHKGGVRSVAFCPDGGRIASGSDDQSIRIWDAETGESVGQPFRGHYNAVTSVIFSPDGKRIVSGSKDDSIRIWDVMTGEPIGIERLQGHREAVTSVSFSPDARTQRIASGSEDRSIRIWDAETGQPVGQPLLGHTDAVTSVMFSPEGSRVVSGSRDQSIRIWDTETGLTVAQGLHGHTSAVTSAVFSPDGSRIASGSMDNSIRIWESQTGLVIGQPLRGHIDVVTSVAFSPDGSRIASGSHDYTIRIWNAETGSTIGQYLQGHLNWVTSVVFSSDGSNIASGSYDGTIRIWEAEPGEGLSQPLGVSAVTSVVFSSDGCRIAAGSYDNKIRIWNAETGELLGRPLLGQPDMLLYSKTGRNALGSDLTNWVFSIAFSPDGSRIASGLKDNTIRIWNTETREPVGHPILGHTAAITSVKFSPDGKRIVSGSEDKSIWIWDVVTGEPVKWLQGHSSAVTSVVFSPDGSRIASGSRDNSVRIWDAQTGLVVGKPLLGHTGSVTSVVFSPDGSRIASGSDDRTIQIWNAETGSMIGECLPGHTDAVTSVSFSPDGRRIASGSWDNSIRIWDAQTGLAVGQPLLGHINGVTSLVFSSDGSRIASGSNDQSIRIWGAETGQLSEQTLNLHNTEAVRSIAAYADSPGVVASTEDQSGWVRNVETGQAVDHHSQGYKSSESREQMSGVGRASQNPQFLEGEPTCCPKWSKVRQKDGWIIGPEGELLLWVPYEFASCGMLYPSTRSVTVIGQDRTLSVDFSNFRFGENWASTLSSRDALDSVGDLKT